MNNQNLNDEYRRLKSTRVTKVVLDSFEDDNSRSEGFFCEKSFNPDLSESVMISKSYITEDTELKTFYNNGKVVKTISSSPSSVNIVGYEYKGDLLISVKIETKSDSSISFYEERNFDYDEAGRLTEMIRFKNGKKVSVIRFDKDDKGNIIEEVPVEGSTDRKYYYYYDEENRLTDVVHFNEIAQKLLPDYMFLYNENDMVSQMISVDESARNYVIWRYAYTPEGLPEIQKCYSKEKRLLGTIQFEYFTSN